MPKVQYSMDPNQEGYPLKIYVDGVQIFHDSGARNRTNEFVDLLEKLSSNLGFEVEDISPEYVVPKGNFPSGTALIAYMEKYDATPTNYIPCDDPRRFLIGFIDTRRNWRGMVALNDMQGVKELVDHTERLEFCRRLNERNSSR